MDNLEYKAKGTKVPGFIGKIRDAARRFYNCITVSKTIRKTEEVRTFLNTSRARSCLQLRMCARLTRPNYYQNL